MKSRRLGRLKYTTCHDTTPADVAIRIISEAKELVLGGGGCRRSRHGTSAEAAATAAARSSLTDDTDVGLPPPPLTSTMVVCPHVTAWNDDFAVFDDFVKNFALLKEEDLPVTLVSFHPQFLRWRGLSAEIQVGSIVQSHVNTAGILGKKSTDAFPATVLETSNPVFGQRKIKVRFHDFDDLIKKKEQYIPVDWLVASRGGGGDTGISLGPPLPDNAMHRAPYPTVHLIRNEDLVIPCRDVSRVKRKNAQRMMKLGWKGVLVYGRSSVLQFQSPPNDVGRFIFAVLPIVCLR
jgi:hypothetical protein